MEKPFSSQFPLRGKRILYTGIVDNAGSFSVFLKGLQSLGAQVSCLPLIQVVPMPFDVPALTHVDWLFFTSKQAVLAFFKVFQNEQAEFLPVRFSKIAVVGASTAQCLNRLGLQASFISKHYAAKEAAQEFISHYSVPGQKLNILWPCGNIARSELGTTFEQAVHISLKPLVVYHTTLKQTLSLEEKALFKKPFEMVIFTSPSGVKAFQQCQLQVKNIPVVATIGKTTTESLKTLFDRKPDIQPQTQSLYGLLQAIIADHSIK